MRRTNSHDALKGRGLLERAKVPGASSYENHKPPMGHFKGYDLVVLSDHSKKTTTSARALLIVAASRQRREIFGLSPDHAWPMVDCQCNVNR